MAGFRRRHGPTRARLLKSAARCAGALSLWLAAGRVSEPRAAATELQVPTVDKLSVRVVLDNSHEFLGTDPVGGVTIERTNPDFSSSRATKLESQFGLSLFLESFLASLPKRYLLDFGLTGDALSNNRGVLGIFPGTRISSKWCAHKC